MSAKSLKAIVESLIFVHDHPLSLDRRALILEEFERVEIRQALEELVEDIVKETKLALSVAIEVAVRP